MAKSAVKNGTSKARSLHPGMQDSEVTRRETSIGEKTLTFRATDRQSLDLPSWENLTSGGSFFHTHQWIDICLSGLRHDSRAIFLCGYEDDRLVAGMPAIETRRFGIRSFYSMPYATYGGMILTEDASDSHREDFYSHLGKYLRKNKYSKVIITDFDGNLAGWKALPLRRTGCFTHIIDLDSENDYRPADKKIEAHIRAGQKANTKIVHIKSSKQLDTFYRLYCLTERRHGQRNPLYSKRFFSSILDRLGDSPQLIWNGIEAEETIIGSCINFIHGNTLFNWQTVSDYEKRHFKPNHILLYEAIREGLTAGIKKVNLGASPHYAHGLIDYKERWGGVRIDYDCYSNAWWLRRLLRR